MMPSRVSGSANLASGPALVSQDALLSLTQGCVHYDAVWLHDLMLVVMPLIL